MEFFNCEFRLFWSVFPRITFVSGRNMKISKIIISEKNLRNWEFQFLNFGVLQSFWVSEFQSFDFEIHFFNFEFKDFLICLESISFRVSKLWSFRPSEQILTILIITLCSFKRIGVPEFCYFFMKILNSLATFRSQLNN